MAVVAAIAVFYNAVEWKKGRKKPKLSFEMASMYQLRAL